MAESRRERVRAATMREITETARQILVDEGPDAVTLRAIAREMGMTAPALYRYFGSHQDLMRHLIGDIFTDLTGEIKAALHEAPPDDMTAKFKVTAEAFRRWALGHRREYTLVFGTPLPGLDIDHGDFATECGREFGLTFLMLFTELWHRKPFPVPADDEIDPRLREQLERYRDGLDTPLPLGTLLIFLDCWVRLQGIVSLEVFGHLDFALDEPAPMFDRMLGDLAPLLGLSI